MDLKKYIKLGKIVKLHGIVGEVKIATAFDKDFDIKKIESLFDENGNEFKVKRIMKSNDGIFAGFENVDLETAQKMIGKYVFVNRSLFSGKILIEDLKESDVVFDDGKNIGKIFDIQDYGSAEVFFVKLLSGRELLFPNVKDLIVSFDYEAKKLVVNKTKLKEVSDYEDWCFNIVSWNVWTNKAEYFEKGNRAGCCWDKFNKY